jgi:hypothetical protein
LIIVADQQGEINPLGQFPLLKIIHRENSAERDFVDLCRRIIKIALIERGRDDTIEVQVFYQPMIRIGIRHRYLVVFGKETAHTFSRKGYERSPLKEKI